MANNLDAFIPELWSSRLVELLRQQNIALDVVANTDYTGEIRNAGDTIWFRTPSTISGQSYVRGATISYQDLAPSKESMTVNEAKVYPFAVDDLDEAQSDINILTTYTREVAAAMSDDIDDKVFSYHSSALAANKLSDGGSAYDITVSSGPANVYELIVAANLRLDTVNAPATGRWIIVTPYFKSLLMKETTYFIKGSMLGDTIITSGRAGATAQEMAARGFVGQIGGLDVYVSNNLPASGANFYCIYGQGKPVLYAAQIPPSGLEVLRLESTMATAGRALLLHDGKVLAEHSKRLGTILVDNS